MNTAQPFSLPSLNPAYHVLMTQAVRQAEGYNMVALGTYQGQNAYIEGRTNKLYLGTSKDNARLLETSRLEQTLNEVN